MTFTRPEHPSMLANLPEGEASDEVISYQDYLEQCYPRGDDGQRSDEANQNIAALQAAFAKPGSPGSKFKNQQEKLLKTLGLPKGAKEELGISGEDGTLKVEESEQEEEKKKDGDGEESEDLDPKAKAELEAKKFEKKMNAILFGEGKYFMVPSFFRTLMYLKKQKKEFSVIFRSFGTELDPVIWEYNKFCSGEHPCFNGRNNTPLVKLDGSKNSKDMRISQACQKAVFYRFGDNINESTMVTGNNPRKATIHEVNQIEEDDDTTIVRDHLDIFQTMLETFKKYGSMSMSEDYPAWDAAGRTNSRAKLLLVDQADYNTQHIFFDDNADEGDDCIVDVRDVITGEKVDQGKYMDMYVVKAQPHRAILESDYFIKMIE